MCQHPVAPVAGTGPWLSPPPAGPQLVLVGLCVAAARAPCGRYRRRSRRARPGPECGTGARGVPARWAPWLVRRFPRGSVALPRLVRSGMGKEGWQRQRGRAGHLFLPCQWRSSHWVTKGQVARKSSVRGDTVRRHGDIAWRGEGDKGVTDVTKHPPQALC